MRPIALASVITLLATAVPAAAQNAYTWASTTSSNWLQSGNWRVGSTSTFSPSFPGLSGNGFGTGAQDEADFGATLPASLAVGIDMTAANGSTNANRLLILGGISFQNNSNSLAIGNSSTANAGVLQLLGTTLPVTGASFPNVILSNTSTSQTLTVQDTVNGGTRPLLLSVPVDSRIFVNSGATIVISTQITGLGGITSYGNGSLVLSGANTYANGTVVEQGTLRVANGTVGSATGTGTVSVAPGARLMGTGTVVPDTGTPAGNTVTVNGTLQPGTDAATGTLRAGTSGTNATVALNNSGTYRWTVSNVGSPSTTPGGSSATSTQSELVVNGNLTFTPGIFDVVGLGGSTGFDNTQPYSWRVATATGGVSIGSTQPTFNVTGLNTGGGSFFLSSGVGSVFLNFAPIPEPAAVLLVCVAAAGVVRSVRRYRATST
jgi:autotransporter-associated beta strand protein